MWAKSGMCWEAWAACRLRQPKRKKRLPIVGPLSMSTEGARPTKSCVAGAIPWGVVGSSPPTSSCVTDGSSAQGHGGMRATATRCWRCAVPNITGHSIGCLRALNTDCGQRKNHRMLPGVQTHVAGWTIEIWPLQLDCPHEGLDGTPDRRARLPAPITLKTAGLLPGVFTLMDIRDHRLGEAAGACVAYGPYGLGHRRQGGFRRVQWLLQSIKPLVKALVQALA